jgi:hypothetical protein
MSDQHHDDDAIDQINKSCAFLSVEHSLIMNNHEQYLICLKDEHPPLSDKHQARVALNSIGHSATPSSSSSSDDGEESTNNLRTVEKSRTFTDQQQKATSHRQNRWDANLIKQR